ncbi:MAG: hypothetical protein ACFFD4_36480 [Candidatus Odinarchaeota archaeon]
MAVSDMLIEDIAFNAARKGAEEFLRPRTAAERLFLISVVLYAVFSLIKIKEYRFFFFVILLVTALASWLQGSRREQEGSSLFSTGFKLLVAVYLVTEFFTGVWYEVALFPPDTNINYTYLELERYFTSVFFFLGVFMTAIKLEYLERGSLDSYFSFLNQLANGFWRLVVALAIFISFGWFPDKIGEISVDYEFLLLIAIAASLFFAAIPRKQVSNNILQKRGVSLETVFWAQSNSYSRIRDTLLVNLVVMIIFSILQLFAGIEAFWGQAILLILIAIIIIVVIEPAEMRKSRSKSVIDSFQGVGSELSDQAANRVSKMKSQLDNLQFKKPEDVYVMSKKESVLKKGKINFQTDEGSVIVPVQETREGATIVVVGKGDVEVEDEQGRKEVKKFDGSTTMLLSPDDWEVLKQQRLRKLNFDSLDVKNLPVPVENIEQLTDTVASAVDRMKNWKGPANLLKQEVKGLTEGKYGVMETKDATVVNFPGIKVLETKGLTAVRLPFLQVLESKEGTMVNMPFLKVIERKDYDYVSIPGFLQVLDTKHGEIVKVFGMRFGSGDPKQLEGVIDRLASDEAELRSSFSQKLNNLLSEQGTDFLLTESANGEVLQITAGENDSIVEELGSRKKSRPEKSILADAGDEVFVVGDDGRVTGKEPLEIKSYKARLSDKTSFEHDADQKKIRISVEKGHHQGRRTTREIEKRVKKLQQQIEQLDDALIEGKISEEKHDKMLKRLQSELQELKDELEIMRNEKGI